MAHAGHKTAALLSTVLLMPGLSACGSDGKESLQIGESYAFDDGDGRSGRVVVESIAVSSGTENCTTSTPDAPQRGYWVVFTVDVKYTGHETFVISPITFYTDGEGGNRAGGGSPDEAASTARCVQGRGVDGMVPLGEGQTRRVTFAIDSDAAVGSLTWEAEALRPFPKWSFP